MPGIASAPSQAFGPRSRFIEKRPALSAGGGIRTIGTSRSGASDATGFTSTTSWTHSPTETVTAAVVAISQPLTVADEVSSVTYGGQVMTRVISQAGAGGEPARMYIYLLNTNVPQGPQSIQVNTSGTTAQKQAHAFALAADPGLQIVVDVSGGTNLGIVANPFVNAAFTGNLNSWWGLAVHAFGGDTPTATGLRPGQSYAYGFDPGAAVSMTYYREAGAPTNATTFGYNTLASDDQHIVWVVLKQTIQYTLTAPIERDEALPLYKYEYAKTKIVTLTPDATTKGDWTLVGGASQHAALADASDASYVESTTSGHIGRFTLTSYTLAADEYISGLRVRIRAATQANHTIGMTIKTPSQSDSAGGYSSTVIPASTSIREFTTPLYPGAGNPFASTSGNRSLMDQTMLDGLFVEFTLSEGAAEAGTSKVYYAVVDAHISKKQPRVVRRGRRLHFDTGPEARFMGVNYSPLRWPQAITRRQLQHHKEAGFNLFRFHIYVDDLKTAAGSTASVWKQNNLGILTELLQWMNDEGLYADMTLFASYYNSSNGQNPSNPSWYEGLSESARWDERRIIARQLGGMFDRHPAVAYWGLGNEFIAPSTIKTHWRLGDSGGGGTGPLFAEYVVKDPAARSVSTIWGDWITDILSASDGFRLVNTSAPVGVGSFQSYLGEGAGVLPPSVAALNGMTIILEHIYPERTGQWRADYDRATSDLAGLGLGIPIIINEFFFDVVTGEGYIAEMDAVYNHAVGDISGFVGQTDVLGRTSRDYIPPEPNTITELLYQHMARWFEDRAHNFRKHPRIGRRMGEVQIPPRYGGRL